MIYLFYRGQGMRCINLDSIFLNKLDEIYYYNVDVIDLPTWSRIARSTQIEVLTDICEIIGDY